MTDITIRYRDSRNPRTRGTYLLINGRQVQKISSSHLSRKQIELYRAQYIANLKGYILVNGKTLQKQEDDDRFVEITQTPFQFEVTEIKRDENGVFQKEEKEDRDYADLDDSRKLEQILTNLEGNNSSSQSPQSLQEDEED